MYLETTFLERLCDGEKEFPWYLSYFSYCEAFCLKQLNPS